MEVYYPEIQDNWVWAVANIFRLAKENPDYFFNSACPYPQDVRDWFIKCLQVEEVSIEDLDNEARKLFLGLKKLGSSLETSSGTETKEKLAYYSSATKLLEKLIVLQSRASDARAVKQFQKTVLSIIDEYLTPEERTTVMDKIKALGV